MNTFTPSVSSFAHQHLRGLAALVLAIVVLAGAHDLIDGAVAAQAGQAAAIDQLTMQPAVAVAVVAPAKPAKWIPLADYGMQSK